MCYARTREFKNRRQYKLLPLSLSSTGIREKNVRHLFPGAKEEETWKPANCLSQKEPPPLSTSFWWVTEKQKKKGGRQVQNIFINTHTHTIAVIQKFTSTRPTKFLTLKRNYIYWKNEPWRIQFWECSIRNKCLLHPGLLWQLELYLHFQTYEQQVRVKDYIVFFKKKRSLLLMI